MTGTRIECGRVRCRHLVSRHDKKGRCEVLDCTCTRFEGVFTKREFEILLLFAKGLKLKDIAVKFNLSLKTVEAHRYNMMVKAGTHSMVELVLQSLRCELIKIEDLAEGTRDLAYFEALRNKEKNAS